MRFKLVLAAMLCASAAMAAPGLTDDEAARLIRGARLESLNGRGDIACPRGQDCVVASSADMGEEFCADGRTWQRPMEFGLERGTYRVTNGAVCVASQDRRTETCRPITRDPSGVYVVGGRWLRREAASCRP